MKKRLEAELISIAHRVLKLKNKSEIDQLYKETQKLYETLSILKFYDDNYEQLKSELSIDELEDKIDSSLKSEVILESEKIEEPILKVASEIDAIETDEIQDEVEKEEKPIIVGQIDLEDEDLDEEEIVSEKENKEDDLEEIVSDLDEDNEDNEDETEEEVPVLEAKSDIDFEPIFEFEPVEEVKNEKQQISFDDLLGVNYSEPIFVKPNDVVIPNSKKEEISEDFIEKEESKSLSLNDTFSRTITIGLNDRIGFVNHLFDENTEDFNRVLSQLNSFSSFVEAKDFIEEIIKPDYNNWDGKEEYAERFMEIVSKKFQ